MGTEFINNYISLAQESHIKINDTRQNMSTLDVSLKVNTFIAVILRTALSVNIEIP